MTTDQMVSVPMAEYLELLECKQRLAQKMRPRSFPRSPIDRDGELAAFLTERFGMMPVKAILAECAAVYGSERTPSMSAAYRFWQRIGEVASKAI